MKDSELSFELLQGLISAAETAILTTHGNCTASSDDICKLIDSNESHLRMMSRRFTVLHRKVQVFEEIARRSQPGTMKTLDKRFGPDRRSKLVPPSSDSLSAKNAAPLATKSRAAGKKFKAEAEYDSKCRIN